MNSIACLSVYVGVHSDFSCSRQIVPSELIFGWYIFVSNLIDGGEEGYCCGIVIDRKKTPSSYGVFSGGLRVTLSLLRSSSSTSIVNLRSSSFSYWRSSRWTALFMRKKCGQIEFEIVLWRIWPIIKKKKRKMTKQFTNVLFFFFSFGYGLEMSLFCFGKWILWSFGEMIVYRIRSHCWFLIDV